MLKHKTFFLIGLLFLVAVSLISCEESLDSGSFADVPAQFTCSSSANESTRAHDTMWEAGDKVGIYMVPHTANASDPADLNSSQYGTLFSNVPYVTATEGKTVSLTVSNGVPAINYPSNSVNKVNFVAYYPYSEDTHTTNNNIYPVDVTTQSPLKAIDLLYHKGTGTAYNRKSGEVSLEFTHKLCKLNVSVVPLSGESQVDPGKSTAALTGFPTETTFNLASGIFSASNTASTTETPIVPIKSNDSTTDYVLFEAILPPHSGSDFTRTISLVIDSKPYSYTLPETVNMESGKAYTYSFKFTGRDIVLVQNTISDWEGVVFGDSQFAVSTKSVELKAAASTGNTFTMTTNSQTAPTWQLSTSEASVTETVDWLTDTTISKTSETGGFSTYTLTYNASAHTNTAAGREAYYHVTVDGMTLVVKVLQDKLIYLNAATPSPFEFNLAAPDQRNLSFTVTTNSTEPTLQVGYTLDGTTSIGRPDWLVVESPTRTVSNNIATFTTTFAVSENYTSEAARTAWIHLTVNGLEQKIKIAQATVVTTDIKTVPAGEEANCYIVEPGSKTLRFPIARAVQYGGMSNTATFTAEVLWDDNGVIGTPITGATPSGGYASITTTNNVGNAMVAIKSGGVIQWSYHIWVVNYTPDAADANTYWINPNNTAYKFMDRNLGATENTLSAASRGLFYQWGRKDPFPGGPYAAGHNATDKFHGINSGATNIGVSTNAEAFIKIIRNPTTYYTVYNTNYYFWAPEEDTSLWNTAGQKTVYDPCPLGWRVPTSGLGEASPWYNLPGATWTASDDDGGIDWGTNGCFPAAGYNPAGSGVWSWGHVGYYWSATIYNIYGIGMTINNGGGLGSAAQFGRTAALSVRCVAE